MQQQDGEPHVHREIRFRLESGDPESRRAVGELMEQIQQQIGIRLIVHERCTDGHVPTVAIAAMEGELSQEAIEEIIGMMTSAGYVYATVVRMPGGITQARIDRYASMKGFTDLVNVRRTGRRKTRMFVVTPTEVGSIDNVDALAHELVAYFSRYNPGHVGVVMEAVPSL